MERRYRLRQIVNIVNASTPLGMLLARAGGSGGLRRGPHGLLIGTGYRLPLPAAPAFTVGNVVLVRDDGSILRRRPSLLAHEARHATQYAVCGGLPMLLLYPLAMAVSLAISGDLAAHNVFERLAGLADGGYRPRSPRWRRSP